MTHGWEDKETDAGPSQAIEAKKEILPSDNTNNIWKNWTPAALKTKVSNPPKREFNQPLTSLSWLRRRRPRTSLQDKVLENKIQLIELSKQNVQSEAALKNRLLQEQIKQEQIKTQN
ncbi:unnamed protein product [Danaus chrysippus]|uniref:(African queen) hypothetical protein n=1 Tax=Danaus chrysippus TaxID=151541 RepID=A0A8J2QEI8_9NEOP|nr:unnamed protein product [Danaus chrysippus]